MVFRWSCFVSAGANFLKLSLASGPVALAGCVTTWTVMGYQPDVQRVVDEAFESQTRYEPLSQARAEAQGPDNLQGIGLCTASGDAWYFEFPERREGALCDVSGIQSPGEPTCIAMTEIIAASKPFVALAIGLPPKLDLSGCERFVDDK